MQASRRMLKKQQHHGMTRMHQHAFIGALVRLAAILHEQVVAGRPPLLSRRSQAAIRRIVVSSNQLLIERRGVSFRLLSRASEP